MQTFQREFIRFALDAEALQLGDFTLKSGRRSPYFFNTGRFATGARLAELGRHYARAIEHSGIDADMLFGSAYKGIPLVAASAIALSRAGGRDWPYAFNRKEAKDHGEAGRTVGAPLCGRVIIVDDVISAGTSVRESVQIIGEAGATAAAVVVALDRQERGPGEEVASEELGRSFGIEVISIVNLDHLVEYLAEQPGMTAALERMRAYRAAYGGAY